jgi:hypothetical protein
MSDRGWRDRFNILTFDLHANRPTIGELEQLYFCTDEEGQAHAGEIYRGTGAGWIVYPVRAHTHSAYAPVAHTHPYSAIGHLHDDRYSLLDHTHEEDHSDLASSTTAVHSRKAKTAALADDSNLVGGYSAAQLMLLAVEVFS